MPRQARDSGKMDDQADETEAMAAAAASSWSSSPLAETLRQKVHDYLQQHQFRSALFWSNQLLSLTEFECVSDVLLMAEVLFLDRQYRRLAHLLSSRQLDKTNLRACYMAAHAVFLAKESEEALTILDNGWHMVEEEAARAMRERSGDDDGDGEEDAARRRRQQQQRRQELSSLHLLRGRVLESLDNRGLAAESFRQALRVDVFCYEAYQLLTQHHMLTAAEETELVSSLPLGRDALGRSFRHDAAGGGSASEEQSQEKEENPASAAELYDLADFAYRARMKKYDRPLEWTVPENFAVLLSENTDLRVQQAERHFYNCDYNECIKITDSVIKIDPYHEECLPVHISCLVELNKPNDLFHHAHKLVELFPEWAIAWFAVGSYYYLVGKQDFARRYLSKATQLDRVFGPAWLAYGHSFASENEHDQAMAAYFKACQLMKGCHLPLLYIGVEYGLTNNSKLAERFFLQALEIAPNDPFALHELGVTAFQNQDYELAKRYFLKAVQQIQQPRGNAHSSKSQPTPTTMFSPKWESLLNNLGHTFRKLGKYSEALQFHQHALVLQPLSASTFSAIGYVHALKGDLIEAVEAFHKALGLRREDTFSTTMLSNVIEQMTNQEPPFPDFPDEIPKLKPLIPLPADVSALDDTDISLDVEMAD